MDSTNEVSIYILTHKKIIEDYDKSLYIPLLNGSALLTEDFGYLRDDTGKNVSKLNPYLAELTGEYWVWKNSQADIIGFCHYRRWFVKNIFLKKINIEDILTSLNEYDIILPQKTKYTQSVMNELDAARIKNPNYHPSKDDYNILKQYLKKNHPKYYKNYKHIMDGKEIYLNTIFIANKKLANQYFTWLFSIFNDLKGEIDFTKYSKGNKRVFAFFCEILLSVFVKTNKLKIKEYPLHYTERKIPILYILIKKFPRIAILEGKIAKLINLLNKNKLD